MKRFFKKKSKLDAVIVLVDPDKVNIELLQILNKNKIRKFLVGGSVLEKGNVKDTITQIRKHVKKASIVLFPGDETQLEKNADGLLLPLLISGRNPDFIIGKHIRAAKKIFQYHLPTIPVGYILVSGGKLSSTEKISHTKPLTSKELILKTAMAGELIGMKFIYLEAGSGAKRETSNKIIKSVKKCISIPLIVGGGINSVEKINNAISSGADFVVVGNGLENDIELAQKIADNLK